MKTGQIPVNNAVCTRELESSLSNLRIVFLRHGFDGRLEIGQPYCLHHLILRGTQPTVGDVVVDGIVKEDRVLRHYSNCLTNALHGDITNVSPSDKDTPIHRVIETIQESDYGGLAICR